MANQDHWHDAYGSTSATTSCPPSPTRASDDELGIHTHGDGMIHIHPFVNASAGQATPS